MFDVLRSTFFIVLRDIVTIHQIFIYLSQTKQLFKLILISSQLHCYSSIKMYYNLKTKQMKFWLLIMVVTFLYLRLNVPADQWVHPMHVRKVLQVPAMDSITFFKWLVVRTVIFMYCWYLFDMTCCVCEMHFIANDFIFGKEKRNNEEYDEAIERDEAKEKEAKEKALKRQELLFKLTKKNASQLKSSLTIPDNQKTSAHKAQVLSYEVSTITTKVTTVKMETVLKTIEEKEWTVGGRVMKTTVRITYKAVEG